MALVIFLRGVNVGGHKAFQPSALAREMASFQPGGGLSSGERSPNRLDALVWLVTDLMLASNSVVYAAPVSVGTRSSPWRS